MAETGHTKFTAPEIALIWKVGITFIKFMINMLYVIPTKEKPSTNLYMSPVKGVKQVHTRKITLFSSGLRI